MWSSSSLTLGELVSEWRFQSMWSWKSDWSLKGKTPSFFIPFIFTSGCQGSWQVTFVGLSPSECKSMQYRNESRTEITQGAKPLVKGRRSLQQKIGKIGLKDLMKPFDLPICWCLSLGQFLAFPTQVYLSIANTFSLADSLSLFLNLLPSSSISNYKFFL